MSNIVKNKWHKPCDKLPEQGKKVLCMDGGDFFVLQRFGKYWFSIPFFDSRFSRSHAPELWQEIDFPNNLTGKILVSVDNELIHIDQLEEKHYDIYIELVRGQVEMFDKKN